MASSIFGQAPTMAAADTMQQAQRILSTLMPASNPQQMLQNLISQNPQYSYLMNLVNQHNGDIRATVLDMAKERGVDINELYKQYMKR